jgi:dTDP-4-dehydrorhamnose reductase
MGLFMQNEKLELWGGIECTINRVKDKYFDQLEYAGHYKREDDIDKIATLGIMALRYPVLWEKHQPEAGSKISWAFAEKNLNKLRSHGIKPIVGLVHHGSGPSFVNFFDGSFEKGLARYAEQVARQFPWVEYYTPVNEPLTTARFCGLYGVWYPHTKDNYGFAKVLVSECRAVVMAMKAIQRINPNAKLIQTEDLSKTHSTPELRYQANFENKRRWLSIDLISGKVTPQHSMWDYLVNFCGVDESDLYWLIENNCTPDILGFNYYITSERFLDERLECYPRHTHGRNHKHEYADVEAIRVGLDAHAGPHKLLTEAWQRFKLPMAVTEVHLHCHREEQLRWFNEMWQTVQQLRDEGVDIRAITSWALLGSFGWNKLLTIPCGEYEPGVFDVRSGELRPKALAHVLQLLSKEEEYHHPLLKGDGWWKRHLRAIYHREEMQIDHQSNDIDNCQPLLILGKTGTLGNAFAKVCEHRNIPYKLLGRNDVDVCKPEMIENIIKEYNPWAIINTAGYVRVDDAEHDSGNCFSSNTRGAANLASYCNEYNVQLLTFSSDLVFDGKKKMPYYESDKVNPLNMYGRSKAIAEQSVLYNHPRALIVRTSAFFGPWDQYNFVTAVINSLKNHEPFEAANDVVISPTYVPDLVNASLDLLIDKEHGIWHIANNGETTWADLARMAAEKFGLDTDLIHAKPMNEMFYTARRPRYSVLRSEKGVALPTLRDALERYFYEAEHILQGKELVEV